MRDSGDAVLPDSSSSSPSPPRSVPSFLPFVGRVYFLVGFSLCEGFRGLESTRRGAGVVLVVFTIKCNSVKMSKKVVFREENRNKMRCCYLGVEQRLLLYRGHWMTCTRIRQSPSSLTSVLSGS